MKKSLLLAFFATLYMMSIGQSNAQYSPDFTAITMEKDTFNLVEFWNEYPNKYVALEFFFTESQFCQEISPMVDSAYQYFGNNEHDIHFISINMGNDSAACKKYIDSLSIQHGVVPGIGGNGNDITNAFEIQSFPTVILMSLDSITYIDTIMADDTINSIEILHTNIIIQDIWPIIHATDIIDTILVADSTIYPSTTQQANGIFKPENALSSLFIYPNPADEFIKVEISDFDSEINYQILDLSGRMILNQRKNTLNSQEIEINVSQLQKGIYFLRLFDGKRTASQKINIQ
ncbi:MULTISPECIES: T9SS type A sorting domain-containing protein [unclassified Lentimicrobium]|uniref:T9SS type A sorting domain-containing protein n=1 Tax=unclassified Lentimicrobium TaxID=2677434 RepID=UPI0015524151|nr:MULTISPECIES: T9SS type A sorting domain-containing protein [unclassified Lentimicrobium]NPD46060.1 T9SS type A sorting domain-containing protein [Lentimicrobium sp. S6]NPD84964.1 T9SS type A sorting domain-containing protein [Lentimicrobium sp. L6]